MAHCPLRGIFSEISGRATDRRNESPEACLARAVRLWHREVIDPKRSGITLCE